MHYHRLGSHCHSVDVHWFGQKPQRHRMASYRRSIDKESYPGINEFSFLYCHQRALFLSLPSVPLLLAEVLKLLTLNCPFPGYNVHPHSQALLHRHSPTGGGCTSNGRVKSLSKTRHSTPGPDVQDFSSNIYFFLPTTIIPAQVLPLVQPTATESVICWLWANSCDVFSRSLLHIMASMQPCLLTFSPLDFCYHKYEHLHTNPTVIFRSTILLTTGCGIWVRIKSNKLAAYKAKAMYGKVMGFPGALPGFSHHMLAAVVKHQSNITWQPTITSDVMTYSC